MKTIRTILAIAITILFVSCGEEKKEITVTGVDGKVYKSYQAACRDNDYEAAHEFLDLMKKDVENAKNPYHMEDLYQEAVDYVYGQEMIFLISEGNEEFSNRAIYLLTDYYTKTEDEYKLNDLCGKAVDLAFSQGYIELVKKLLAMYKDSQAKAEKCIQMLSKSDEFKDLALNALAGYRIEGPASAGLHDEIYSGYKVVADNNGFNVCCNQLFDYAINHGNKEIAQKVLQMYKQSVVVTEGSDDEKIKVNGVRVDGEHCYVTLTWQDRDAAQKRFKEAVANGVFKK